MQNCAKRFGKHNFFNVYLQQIFSQKMPDCKNRIIGAECIANLAKD